jgi:major vault protein
MEYGPITYLPPVQVQVLEKRSQVPLNSNEGIYVKDTRSGAVRAVIGKPYMLKAHEIATEIEISKEFENLIQKENNVTKLDKT